MSSSEGAPLLRPVQPPSASSSKADITGTRPAPMLKSRSKRYYEYRWTAVLMSPFALRFFLGWLICDAGLTALFQFALFIEQPPRPVYWWAIGSMFVSTFLNAFLITVVSSIAVSKCGARRGRVSFVEDSAFNFWLLRAFPVRVRNTLLRALLFGLAMMVYFGGPAVIGLVIACEVNADNCIIDTRVFGAIKLVWSIFTHIAVFPIIFVSSLNKNNFDETELHAGEVAAAQYHESKRLLI